MLTIWSSFNGSPGASLPRAPCPRPPPPRGTHALGRTRIQERTMDDSMMYESICMTIPGRIGILIPSGKCVRGRRDGLVFGKSAPLPSPSPPLPLPFALYIKLWVDTGGSKMSEMIHLCYSYMLSSFYTVLSKKKFLYPIIK